MARNALIDSLRARAHGSLGKLPGRFGEKLRDLNEAMGRPLASSDELAERRAFEQGLASPAGAALGGEARSAAPKAAAAAAAAAASSAAGVTTADGRVAAPVVVYHLDKHRSQLPRLTQTLDGADIPYRILNLEGDSATQGSIKRDSNNRKLPLVFIAGECVGGRDELHALERSGELKKKVWG
jgi:glutaredoxin